MQQEKRYPADVMRRTVSRIVEASGMLAMLKPLLKRPNNLTNAEQELLEHTFRAAGDVLNKASRELYQLRYGPPNGTGTELRQAVDPTE
jgi:hypothetical protein